MNPTDDASREPDGPPKRDAETTGKPQPSESLLDKILYNAANTPQAPQPAMPDDDLPPMALEPLVHVARQHLDESLDSESVAFDLVEALFRLELPELADYGKRQWQAMCTNVAETLLEDPAARQRLERLWAQLVAMAK